MKNHNKECEDKNQTKITSKQYQASKTLNNKANGIIHKVNYFPTLICHFDISCFPGIRYIKVLKYLLMISATHQWLKAKGIVHSTAQVFGSEIIVLGKIEN